MRSFNHQFQSQVSCGRYKGRSPYVTDKNAKLSYLHINVNHHVTEISTMTFANKEYSSGLCGETEMTVLVGCTASYFVKIIDVPIGFVTPPPLILRLCIALFAVTEGWLLIDIE